MHNLLLFLKEAVLGTGEQRHLLSKGGRVSCGIRHWLRGGCVLRPAAWSAVVLALDAGVRLTALFPPDVVSSNKRRA